MAEVSMKTPLDQTDLRVRRTHKLLWEALMAEMAARPFEEITVKDICERAMVHRTTFYTHYADKYDLLEQGMRQMLEALVAGEPHQPPSAYSAEHPPVYFIRLFEQAAEHQQFYKLMLCGEGVGRFQKMIKAYVAEVAGDPSGEGARNVSGDGVHDPALAVSMDMHAQFVAGATVSLLAWWLEHDMPLSPQQMAQYLRSPYGSVPALP
jgi:AcrR family transcriptional regulator